MRQRRHPEGDEPAWPVLRVREGDTPAWMRSIPPKWLVAPVPALGLAFLVLLGLDLVLGPTALVGWLLLAVTPSVAVGTRQGWQAARYASAVRRLQLRTAAMLPLVDAPGYEAWLTAPGLFVAPNKLIGWREFLRYRSEDQGAHTVRVILRRTHRYQGLHALSHITAAAFAEAVLALVAWAAFTRHGLTLESLTALVGALLFAPFPILSIWLIWQARPHLRDLGKPGELVLLVNTEKVPLDGVLSTLERHLGPELPEV